MSGKVFFFDTILDYMLYHKSLRRIAGDLGLPHRTLQNWMALGKKVNDPCPVLDAEQLARWKIRHAANIKRPRARYSRPIKELAELYGVKVGTAQKWIAIGKDAGDKCPLDSPAEMARWWKRNMKTDNVLIGYSLPKKKLAVLYGVDISTLAHWVNIGKKSGDFCPLDDPIKMQEWWKRNMKNRVNQQLVLAGMIVQEEKEVG